MPRRRELVVGGIYHVLNRSNSGETIFRNYQDYQAFLILLEEAKQRFQVLIYGYCLMPNHYHLIVSPLTDTALSEFMHWLFGTHANRYHKHYSTFGHLWQGRFKHFVIEGDDEDFCRVLRYVERNPVRAGLVSAASQWLWSSYKTHANGVRDPLVDPSPVRIPGEWEAYVREPLTDGELKQIRARGERKRGRPKLIEKGRNYHNSSKLST